MGYSEGNAYTPINKWALHERGLGEGPWQTVKVVDTKAEAEAWVEQNRPLGWQKFAYSQLDK